MLSFLKEDGRVDYVIVSYIDRFARRLRDHVLIKLAIEQTGAKLVSATENIDNTDAGQLIEGVLAVVAEFQSNHNVGKVKDGLLRKAESGGTPRPHAPIGYLNVIEQFDGRPIRVVKMDRERALSSSGRSRPTLRASGQRHRDFTEALNSKGLPRRSTWSSGESTVGVVECVVHAE